MAAAYNGSNDTKAADMNVVHGQSVTAPASPHFHELSPYKVVLMCS